MITHTHTRANKYTEYMAAIGGFTNVCHHRPLRACLCAQTGSFPEFPSVEEGGSKAFFNPPPPAPSADGDGDDEDGKKDKKGAKKKGTKEKKKSGKKGKKGSGKKGKKGGGDEGDEAEQQGPPPSVFVPVITEGCDAYRSDWKGNMSDRLNVHQKHDRDVVKAIKRTEVEDELRLQVRCDSLLCHFLV